MALARTPRTERTDCGTCGARIILPGGGQMPPLDHSWDGDPDGAAIAWRLAIGGWRARWAVPGEVPAFPERRYQVHRCR